MMATGDEEVQAGFGKVIYKDMVLFTLVIQTHCIFT